MNTQTQERRWNIVELNKSTNTVVRKIENLSTIEAELTYFKISITNPVRNGYNTLLMEPKGS
jgi:hypothetical protein